ncbi:hypothetical protein OH76DRAFT_1395966 [Lentinus brumalis]|uniref:Uncharacterized protein n=1 Tax=Lentinus brumalis TaxID=2498619 RepID=A0A371DWA5_9APHY|nr:hypothetical protein OH76DRAFT_1395966 [Polyporus brumalis]
MAKTGTSSTPMKLITKPHGVRATLLRPSREHQSLSFQMRLSGSPEHLNMYCEVVEKVAKLVDAYKPAVSGPRARAQWQTFVDHVRKECPILGKYEEAWPVAVIFRMHRRYNRRHGPKSIGLANWSKYIDTSSAGLKTPQPPRAATQLDLDSPHADAESVVREPSGSNSEAATDRWTLAQWITRDLSAKAANTQEETEVASTLSSTTASTLTLTAENAPVLAFLRNLVPEQTALLPVFVSKGVTNNAELQGLARMPKRDEFVYSWVKTNHITELQFFAIMTGLRGE